jgi:4-hydroxy-3-methylbut-2-enyl diphosphate reductase
MVVVGGYNSSNTCNLANICSARVPTFHIADVDCLVNAGEVRHRPVSPAGSPTKTGEITSGDWLPPTGGLVIGLTAGASTPNNIVGQVVERLDSLTNLRQPA